MVTVINQKPQLFMCTPLPPPSLQYKSPEIEREHNLERLTLLYFNTPRDWKEGMIYRFRDVLYLV